jgi:F0F1-type ATP synthase membrane subunit a
MVIKKEILIMIKFILAIPSAVVVFFGIIFSYIKDFIKGEKQENGEDFRIFVLFLLGFMFILGPIILIPATIEEKVLFLKEKFKGKKK